MQSNYSDPTVAALFAGGARVILRSRVSTPRIVNVPVGESSLVTVSFPPRPSGDAQTSDIAAYEPCVDVPASWLAHIQGVLGGQIEVVCHSGSPEYETIAASGLAWKAHV